MSRFTIQPMPLVGMAEINRKVIGDHRDYLTRFFYADGPAAVGFDRPIAQINRSYSAEHGAVCELHSQYPPHTEIKLVSCVRGRVSNVATNPYVSSPTFLQ